MGSSPGRPRRALWAALIVGFWVLLGIGAVLAGTGIWVRRTFGTITVDQLLSNLPGGGEGTGGGTLASVAVVTGLVIPIAAVLAIAVVAECARRQLRRRGALRGWRTGMLRGIALVLAVLVPLGGGAVLGSTIGAREYVEAVVRETTTGEGVADYYVAPRGGGNDGTEDRRNLVVIYLESIEDAMGDAELFGRNMLAPVQEATEGWDTIPRLQQYEGGGWTMSGIVSTQCGIPLRTADAFTGPTELNRLGNDGAEVGEYLGGATCLGDVLSREGYRNVAEAGGAAEVLPHLGPVVAQPV
ncbi:MAG: hypothetical protein QM606_10170, partial [Leucobacter sp.]